MSAESPIEQNARRFNYRDGAQVIQAVAIFNNNFGCKTRAGYGPILRDMPLHRRPYRCAMRTAAFVVLRMV